MPKKAQRPLNTGNRKKYSVNNKKKVEIFADCCTGENVLKNFLMMCTPV